MKMRNKVLATAHAHGCRSAIAAWRRASLIRSAPNQLACTMNCLLPMPRHLDGRDNRVGRTHSVASKMQSRAQSAAPRWSLATWATKMAIRTSRWRLNRWSGRLGCWWCLWCIPWIRLWRTPWLCWLSEPTSGSHSMIFQGKGFVVPYDDNY